MSKSTRHLAVGPATPSLRVRCDARVYSALCLSECVCGCSVECPKCMLREVMPRPVIGALGCNQVARSETMGSRPPTVAQIQFGQLDSDSQPLVLRMTVVRLHSSSEGELCSEKEGCLRLVKLVRTLPHTLAHQCSLLMGLFPVDAWEATPAPAGAASAGLFHAWHAPGSAGLDDWRRAGGD